MASPLSEEPRLELLLPRLDLLRPRLDLLRPRLEAVLLVICSVGFATPPTGRLLKVWLFMGADRRPGAGCEC